ncbi:MAG: cell wall-binding repeat-containing protein [Actinomycetota bacterium]|nr:cell wall-binding repeat-containing protein [Actinomycetota bacterium]
MRIRNGLRRRAALTSVVMFCVAPLLLSGVASSAALDPASSTLLGTTTRVSVASGGEPANNVAMLCSISHNGRYVAFASNASNLVPGDTNGTWDIFVRDSLMDVTNRVSVATGGAQADYMSWDNAISADGRHVAFTSHASNLVPGDTNDVLDVFMRDMRSGETTRVSTASDGTQGNYASGSAGGFNGEVAISADGRYVAFSSQASNLVSDDTNSAEDVFVRDTLAGQTRRVSVASDGAEGNAQSGNRVGLAISADGRYVAFASGATNLVPGGTTRYSVFVHDTVGGVTRVVGPLIGPPDGYGSATAGLAISDDGRYVAFASTVSDLVVGDTNNAQDVFVRDMQAGATTCVSVDSDGHPGGAPSGYYTGIGISADGRYATFASYASNLVPDDTNHEMDIFVRDTGTATTTRVSVASDGTQANYWSGGGDAVYWITGGPDISADGRSVAFLSRASNLIPGGTSGIQAIFVNEGVRDGDFLLSEESSTTTSTVATLRSRTATADALAASGDLTGTVEFEGLELVTVETGAFADKGFVSARWRATLEGVEYTGEWSALVSYEEGARKYRLRGMFDGDLRGTVDGYLAETTSTTGVFDRYTATWRLTSGGALLVSAAIGVEGSLSYDGPATDYPSTELDIEQIAMRGSVYGSNGGPLGATLTTARITDPASPFTGKGFTIMSYVWGGGSGQGWATVRPDSLYASTEARGMLSGPLAGSIEGRFDEGTFRGTTQRIDAGRPPQPELRARIIGPERVSPGQTVDYVVELRNDGLLPAKDVSVVLLPSGLGDHVSSTDGGVYDGVLHSVRWDLIEVLPRSTVRFYYRTTIIWGLPNDAPLGFSSAALTHDGADALLAHHTAPLSREQMSAGELLWGVAGNVVGVPFVAVSELFGVSQLMPDAVFYYIAKRLNMAILEADETNLDSLIRYRDAVLTLLNSCRYDASYIADHYPAGSTLRSIIIQLRQDSGVTSLKADTFSHANAARDPNAMSVTPTSAILPGTMLEYTIDYENEGEGTAYGVYITDVLDEDLDDSTLSIGGGGTYDAPTRTITWFIGEVGPSEKGQRTLSVSVETSCVSGDEVINYATVHFPSVPEVTPTNPTVSRVETTRPTTPTVVDDGSYTATETVVQATWSAADPESGIAEYQYAIGTAQYPAAGWNSVSDWTSVGTETVVAAQGLSLADAGVYYVSVKARNGLDMWSDVGVSDGIIVDVSPPVPASDATASYMGVATVHITATDTGSGVDWIEYVLDSAAPVRIDGDAASFTVSSAGKHTVAYRAADAAGNVSGTVCKTFTVATTAEEAERVSSKTRYSTAVAIARKGFDTDPTTPGTQWGGVTHVIIASGEDRAAADPLAASGLVWAYDGPLFLVSSRDVPSEVEQAVAEIKTQAGGTVTVHIVGGPVSVPEARYTELSKAVGGGLAKHRLLSTGGRYDMAATIAREMRKANGGVAPEVVLIANGADPAKFFDALALSPIAAAKGYPILLVSAGSVPSATMRVIDEFDPDLIVIGGGVNTVTSPVQKALAKKAPTEQWYVGSRYTTAIRIADKAVAKGWLTRTMTGIAAKLPDALTGGGVVGREGGVLLITDGGKLTGEVGSWLSAHKSEIARCYVFGGPNSVTQGVLDAIEGKLD